MKHLQTINELFGFGKKKELPKIEFDEESEEIIRSIIKKPELIKGIKESVTGGYIFRIDITPSFAVRFKNNRDEFGEIFDTNREKFGGLVNKELANVFESFLKYQCYLSDSKNKEESDKSKNQLLQQLGVDSTSKRLKEPKEFSKELPEVEPEPKTPSKLGQNFKKYLLD